VAAPSNKQPCSRDPIKLLLASIYVTCAQGIFEGGSSESNSDSESSTRGEESNIDSREFIISYRVCIDCRQITV